MKKMLFDVALACLIFYTGMVLLVYFLQDRLLYFPFKEIDANPAAIRLPFEDVHLTASDGATISAWWIPAKNERAVLLFCHGNAGNISHRLDSIDIFNSLGLSILIFDYRGYGTSAGHPSENGTYLDAESAWRYLVDVQKKSPEKIILFGESLGGAVAAEIASRHTAGGLIIMSSFTSIPELAGRLYPFLPARLLSKFRYSTIDKIGAISSPKLIIHSPDDEIIPFAMGRALYEKAAGPKQFLQIKGGHNEGFLVSGELYVQGLKDFLDSHFTNQARH
jgi:fermentation-respiration switch protein FrsA (DUF1100 family)